MMSNYSFMMMEEKIPLFAHILGRVRAKNMRFIDQISDVIFYS